MFAGHWNWIVIGVLVLVLFGGRGKISSLMGDVAKGITSFKKGLRDGSEEIKAAHDEAIDVTPPAKDTVTEKK